MRKRILITGILLIALSGLQIAAQGILKGTKIKIPVPKETTETVPQEGYTPGIMFSTLLNGVNVIARDGSLRLNNKIQNVFVPDGATGKAVMSRADGSEFCRWNWTLDTFGLKPPYKLFGFKQPLNPDGSNFDYNNLKLTKDGKYVVDFYIGEKRFYTFPFSVSTLKPDNPFDGNAVYLTDGPWNDWGYLYYTDADPAQNLVWKIWLREKTFKRPAHKVMVEIVRNKDKKVICQSRENTTYTFRHEWVRYDLDMVNPPVKTSGGAYFKASDLLAVDGDYTLNMSIDGANYGVWDFKVAGGKLNYTGNTIRGESDPLTFVEGGKDAFWYKRR